MTGTVTPLLRDDENTMIPKSTQVSNASGSIHFETLADAVIASSGKVIVRAECTQTGVVGNILQNELTKIVNPVSGVESVNNPLPAQGGRSRENDHELINRYKEIGGATGSSQAGIRAEVEKADGVRSSVVYENDSNVTDDDQIPPRAIHVVVDGGDHMDIAQAIYKTKGLTTQTYGAVRVTIKDAAGESKVVHFSRPQRISVAIKYKLTVNDLYEQATIPQALIEKALEYINNLHEIKNRSGAILDKIGENMSIKRQNLTDARYRALLQLAFLINQGRNKTDDIISLLKAVFTNKFIGLRELHPGSIEEDWYDNDTRYI